MPKLLLSLILLSLSFSVFAQEQEMPNFAAKDSLYREDQFYLGISYNILQQRPQDLRQNKFSVGLSFGVLRDMPFNKARTWAVAAGLGYSINNFNQNLQIGRIEGQKPFYGLIGSDVNYDKNKLTLHYLDLPVELRWRTSTMESHRFWRIYTGLKLSYLLFDNYKFRGDGIEYSIKRNDDLNRLLYGAYVAVGYNTWNVNVYYGLNPIFKKSAELSGKPIEMHTLNLGLLFYIL